MAISDVSISNLALQKLGEERIVALSQDNKQARACNNCFELLRDKELRAHSWNFARKRKILAADATAPAHEFSYAFTLPADFLKLILPARHNLDWRIENHNGALSVLTNDGDSISIRYIARITDEAVFDPSFAEALAAKMAWHMCEELTQSNQKKEDALREYRLIMAEARKANAYENISDEAPEDPWLAARR